MNRKQSVLLLTKVVKLFIKSATNGSGPLPIERQLAFGLRPSRFVMNAAWTVVAVLGVAGVSFADGPFYKSMKPVPETAKSIDPDFFIWGASMVQDKEGLCHLFYSRWRKELGHNAWVTHSEIAHATSPKPLGPYTHVDVALPARGDTSWDGLCTHNPTVHEFEGKSRLKLRLNVGSKHTLPLPSLDAGGPGAGKMVAVTPPEYAGTEVFHTLCLPKDWDPNWRKTGERLPIIFEYAGNKWAPCASTGEPEDACLGYGLSEGRYIWVSLPYISADHKDNEVRWWGDTAATVQYAKTNVPRIIEEYGGDTNAVFLCGFSRGAIAVNFIGLHDDEIAKLWTAFIAHDHFDGAKEWRGTTWGAPFGAYRAAASNRLLRVKGRPYMVRGSGGKSDTEVFVKSVLPVHDNFYFYEINIRAIFPTIPNELVIHPHTDRWLLIPSIYRDNAWRWMNGVVDQARNKKR